MSEVCHTKLFYLFIDAFPLSNVSWNRQNQNRELWHFRGRREAVEAVVFVRDGPAVPEVKGVCRVNALGWNPVLGVTAPPGPHRGWLCSGRHPLPGSPSSSLDSGVLVCSLEAGLPARSQPGL